ncbi:hypothetical protein B0H13DRAFT_1986749 [Mycena leptocephala]|nr:hypothetical protein B0H13DRAFT_1986749 [Mycena leptocephala]
MATSAAQEAELSALLAAISNVRVSNAAGVSIVALLMFDTVLCFPMEVAYMWLSKPGLTKVLYFFSRYYGLAHVIVNIAIVTRSNLSENFCIGYNWWISVGGAMCFTTAVNVILLLRLFAVHNRSRKVLIVLSGLVLAEFVIECYVSVKDSLSVAPTVFLPPSGLPMPGCWYNPHGVAFTAAAWASCLAISTIFFGMTAIKLFTPFSWDSNISFLENLNSLKSVSPLLVAFVADGSIFFVMIFSIVLVATCVTLLSPQHAGVTIPWVIGIYSLASTRLVLNLKHKAASTANTDTATGETIGTMEFRNMRSHQSDGTYC